MSKKAPSSTWIGRERRHQTSVEIRKRGREARVAAERSGGNIPPELPIHPEELAQLKRFGIPQLLDDFRSGSTSILRATMATRKLLSLERESDGLIDKMIALGLISELCKALDRNDSPRLQFEAIWGLTNASLIRPEVVVRSGALPKIVQLLDSPSIPLREQCLWALGNIMTKSVAYRNACVELGALIKIRSLLIHTHTLTNAQYEAIAKVQIPDSLSLVMQGIASIPISRLNFLRQATWAMSSTIRGGDSSDETYREVSVSLPTLRDLILTSDDPHIVANTIWIFADFSEKRPRAILELGVTDRILELGLHAHGTVQAAAGQCISNLCLGDSQSLRALMISRHADLILISHLRSERDQLWVTASWTLSYVCFNLTKTCERLIPHLDIFLERLVDSSIRSEIRQDCACLISLILSTEAGRGLLLSSEKPLEILINTLSTEIERDFDLAGRVVQCAVNLLTLGGPTFAHAFEERGGFRSLERIENFYLHSQHSHDSVLKAALESYDTYYNGEYETEDIDIIDNANLIVQQNILTNSDHPPVHPNLPAQTSSPYQFQLSNSHRAPLPPASPMIRADQKKSQHNIDRVNFQSFMKD